MIFRQKEISIKVPSRGFFIVTDKILNSVNISDVNVGIINLFLKHTSSSLTINENVSPEVRIDMEEISSSLVPDGYNYNHSLEGADDMPAHFKSSMFGVSLNIPITNGKLNLGTWQGIYLNEHRNRPGVRKIVITVWGI
ncbi:MULTISPECIES: secondary thiamine-phosphate synthase enzyme YjbQ [unclassified Lebetimonas]|uniref:secondary thiamine-phosphate synthase enzyme YjbQ n=1 Tax=unclassified Lebetimonas TaxID=2648158 RepID=UPI000462E82E|nr:MULTISPECIES: secondary thiamine-phosphate synthase enzyme YjbQ [unclassified Lebetimonas]